MKITAAFQSQLKEAQGLLNAYQIEEAQSLLRSLKSENSHQERMRQHYFARAEMRRGRTAEALAILEQAIADHPPYIGLYADRASCLYHLGPKTAWRSALNDFSEQLDRCREELSVGSRYRADLLLAKFLEEDAEIAKALRVYESLHTLLMTEKMSRDSILVAAQILRVRAHYSEKAETVTGLYRDLLTLETNENELYQDIEVQHALMLTELSLFGPLKAWARVSSVLKFAPPQDIKLLVFDFLEFVLRKNQKVAPSLLTLASTLPVLDLYEKAMLAVANNELAKEIHVWPREMSLASYLKALSLVIQRSDETSLASEREFLIESLSPSAKGLWRRYFGEESKMSSLLLDKKTTSVSINGRSHCFLKKAASFKLLCALEKTGSASLEKLTRELWQADYDQTYYNRLRVLTQRTDAVLKEISGQAGLLKFSADGISILRLKDK